MIHWKPNCQGINPMLNNVSVETSLCKGCNKVVCRAWLRMMITVKGVNYTDTVNRTIIWRWMIVMQYAVITSCFICLWAYSSNAMHVNEIIKLKFKKRIKAKKKRNRWKVKQQWLTLRNLHIMEQLSVCKKTRITYCETHKRCNIQMLIHKQCSKAYLEVARIRWRYKKAHLVWRCMSWSKLREKKP